MLERSAKNQQERHLLFSSAVCFLYFSIGNISRMFQLINIPREVTYGSYLVLFAIYMAKRIRYVNLFDVVYYAFVFIQVGFGLIFYASYISSSLNIISVFILYLPAYMFFRASEPAILYKGAKWAARYSAIYLLFFYFFVSHGSDNYRMMYAYWISFPICLFAFETLKKRNAVYGFVTAVMFITLFLSGGRGALVLVVLYFAYAFITNDVIESNKIRRIVAIALFVVAFLLIYSNIDKILGILAQYSGVSRNIRKILHGDFFSSSGRDLIYTYSKDLISNSGVLGYGPLASRKLIDFYPYPHSLWYELQLDFGIYIGIALFVMIVYMAIMNLIRYKNSEIKPVVAYISIVGIGSLMISSSYYYEIYVPATIGLYISSFYKLGMIGSPMKKRLMHE